MISNKLEDVFPFKAIGIPRYLNDFQSKSYGNPKFLQFVEVLWGEKG